MSSGRWSYLKRPRKDFLLISFRFLWIAERFFSNFIEAAFFIKGKTFVVSGGGGGPRVKLKSGKDAHEDIYYGESPRPFNYLLIEKVDDGINVTVKGLKKGDSKFFTMEEFKINFN